MKKRFLIHISQITPQTILLFGLISLLFSGGWLLYACHTLRAQGDLSCYSAMKDGFSELLYGVLFHLGAAGLLALVRKDLPKTDP